MIKYFIFGIFTIVTIPAIIAPHQAPTDLEELCMHVESDIYTLERRVDSIIKAREQYNKDSTASFILLPIHITTKSVNNATNTNEDLSEESNDR